MNLKRERERERERERIRESGEEDEPWWKKSQHPSTQILSSRISGYASPGGDFGSDADVDILNNVVVIMFFVRSVIDTIKRCMKKIVKTEEG